VKITKKGLALAEHFYKLINILCKENYSQDVNNINS